MVLEVQGLLLVPPQLPWERQGTGILAEAQEGGETTW